jgi:hypothetical protein
VARPQAQVPGSEQKAKFATQPTALRFWLLASLTWAGSTAAAWLSRRTIFVAALPAAIACANRLRHAMCMYLNRVAISKWNICHSPCHQMAGFCYQAVAFCATVMLCSVRISEAALTMFFSAAAT